MPSSSFPPLSFHHFTDQAVPFCIDLRSHCTCHRHEKRQTCDHRIIYGNAPYLIVTARSYCCAPKFQSYTQTYTCCTRKTATNGTRQNVNSAVLRGVSRVFREVHSVYLPDLEAPAACCAQHRHSSVTCVKFATSVKNTRQ